MTQPPDDPRPMPWEPAARDEPPAPRWADGCGDAGRDAHATTGRRWIDGCSAVDG